MRKKLTVVDLFCGLKGWSQPFKERGHQVISVDIDKAFKPTISADINLLTFNDFPAYVDVVLASPPCETFSIANHPSEHWEKGTYQPKTPADVAALALVEHTVGLIQDIEPYYFVIENPRAMLRKMGIIPYEMRTVTYCQYGEKRMKPTDLWGGFPPSLKLHPACKNGYLCHTPAPRGSSTGTQGMGSSAEKAKIPYQLALDFCKAVENDVGV